MKEQSLNNIISKRQLIYGPCINCTALNSINNCVLVKFVNELGSKRIDISNKAVTLCIGNRTAIRRVRDMCSSLRASERRVDKTILLD